MIEANNVTVEANNETDIDFYGGVVSSNRSLAGGGLYSSVEINNEINAEIDGSIVNTNDNVAVKTNNDEKYNVIIGAGSGSNGVGLAGIKSDIKINDKNDSSISNSKIESGANANVIVNDNVKIDSNIGAVGVGQYGGGAIIFNNDISNEVKSFVDAAEINANKLVNVAAYNMQEINSFLFAAGVGTAGISGNVGTNLIHNKIIAEISNHSKISALEDVSVKSNIDETINNYNFAAAFGGYTLSGAVMNTNINNESSAKIKEYSVINENNINGGNVLVEANNSTDINSYGGVGTGSGNIAVGAVADNVNLTNKINASIDNSTVKAKKDVSVKTNNDEKYDAIIIAGAGSGGVSVAGNIAIIKVNDTNNAVISNSKIESGANTNVIANDSVEIKSSIGAGAGGLYAGVGGTIFYGDISNNTNAHIFSSEINAGKSVNLNAYSRQDIDTLVISLGGGVAGIGLSGNLLYLNSQTKAIVEGDKLLIAGENINVEAKNKLILDKKIMGAGGGLVGVGASVDVTIINNNVSAGFGDGTKANAAKNIFIIADNERDIDNITISAAGGLVGANGSVSVLTIGSNLSDNDDIYSAVADYKDDFNPAISNTNSNINKFFGNTEIKDGTSAIIGANSQITADADIKVQANEKTELDNTVGGASGGIVGVGASVNIADIKTSANSYVDTGAILKAGKNINILSDNNSDIDLQTFIANGGFVAVNAAVSKLKLSDNSTAKLNNDVKIYRAQDINVKANSNSTIDNNIIRVTGGAFVAGATVAIIDKKGKIEASIGNGVIIKNVPLKDIAVEKLARIDEVDSETLANGEYISLDFTGREIDAEIEAELTEYLRSIGAEFNTLADLQDFVIVFDIKSVESGEVSGVNSLNVLAVNNTDINTKSFSGTAGAISVHGDIFDVKTDDITKAYIGNNANILADKNISVMTNGDVKVNADFTSVSIGLIDFGATAANVKIKFDNDVYLGKDDKQKDDNEYNVLAGDITIAANQTVNSTVQTSILSVGLGTVSGNYASTDISGSVDAVIGEGNHIAGNNITAAANAYTNQTADAVMVQAGIAAIGLGWAKSKADVKVKTQLEDGLNIFAGDGLNLKTELENTLYSQTQSGKAGLLTIGGALAETENKSVNNILIGSNNSQKQSIINAANLNISANTLTNQNGAIDVKNVSLLNGAYSDNKNASNSTINIDINGKTDITASNIYIAALNKYIKDDIRNSNAASLSGLDIYHSKNITNISNDTTINFGDDTNVRTYKDKQNHSLFVIDAANDIYARDTAVYKSFSLANGSHITDKITNNASTVINFNGKITALGDLNANVRTDQDIRAAIYGDILSGGIKFSGDALSESNIRNTINVNDGADIFSGRNVYLNLSQNEDETVSIYNTASFVDVYLSALIPLDDSTSKSRITVIDEVNIAQGGAVKAAESVEIGSWNREVRGQGLLNVYKRWLYFIPDDDHREDTSRSYNSYLNNNGALYAGYNNNINIDIGEIEREVFVEADAQMTAAGIVSGIKKYKEYVVSNANSKEAVKYKIKSKNLANSLYDELDRINEQLKDYSGSGETESALKIEKERILFELASLGLSSNIGGQSVINHYTVDYITFDDIYVGIGDIKLNVDNVGGSGAIAASDAPKVVINNNSSLFMEFGDIVVSNSNNGASGKIYQNDIVLTSQNDIKKLNKNKDLAVNFNEFAFGTGDTDSAIIIESSQRDIDLDIDGLLPNITLRGDIENLKGLVSVRADGDIYLYGRVGADDLQVESRNGNIVQSYWNDSYVFHLSNPQTLWENIAKNNESQYRGVTTYKTVDIVIPLLFGNRIFTFQRQVEVAPVTEAHLSDDSNKISNTRSSMIANNIFISGRYLDINGLVQAGIADWNLNILNNNLQLKLGGGGIGSIADAERYYNQNGASKTKNTSFELADAHGNITAYYDIKTKEITVDTVQVKGGGKLELYGHLLNTNANTGLGGELRALDGYSKVNVNNQSDFKINVKNIDTSERNTGEIKITDLAKGVQTIYRFNGTDIVRIDNRGESILSGNQTNYQTKANQRYNWTRGNTANENSTYKRVDSYRSFLGIDWLNMGSSSLEGFSRMNINVGNYDPLAEAEYISMGIAGDSNYKFDYKSNQFKDNVTDGDTQKRTYRTGLFGVITVTEVTRTKYRDRGVKNFYTHSIKADNPIKISFIGYNEQQDLNINSKGAIAIRGTLNAGNSADAVISSNKSIENLGRGSIIAENVSLSAVNGIGNNSDISVILKGGELSAVNTVKGNINIAVKGSVDSGDTKIKNISNNGLGIVKLVSDNSIAASNANSKIKGASIDLISKTGSILGFNGAAFEIQTNLLKVSAKEDINLTKKINGDLSVSKIESLFGDVSLEVRGGNLLSAKITSTDENARIEHTAAWDALGLIDGDSGWSNEQLLYTLQKPEIIEDANIIGENVTIKTSGSIGADNLEGLTFNASEFNSLSEQQQSAVTFAASKGNVSIQEESGGQIVSVLFRDDFSINAKNGMTLASGGNILLGGREDINIISITAAGDVDIKGNKGINNAAADNSANIKGADIILNSNDDIGASDKELRVEVLGGLTAESEKNIYIYSEKNISVNTIDAGQNLSLVSDSDIISDKVEAGKNIALAANNINANQISAGLNIALSAGNDIVLNETASAGLDMSFIADNNITLNTAIAKQNISIIAKSDGNIVSDKVEAGKNIALAANNINANQMSAGLNIALFAGNDIVLNEAASAGLDISFIADNNITLNTAIAEQNISIIAKSDGNIVSDKVEAGKNIALAANNINANQISAGLNIALSAGNDIVLNETASAGLDISFIADNNIALNTAIAKQNISVIAKKDITRIDAQKNIVGQNIYINADNIGTEDKSIGVELKNNTDISDMVLNAKANDSLYINNAADNQDLYFGKIESGNNAVVTSENRDILNKYEYSQISAKNIIINAKKGNIGKANDKIFLTDFDIFSAYAYKDIHIRSGEKINNVGDIKSQSGDIDLLVFDGDANIVGKVNAYQNIFANILVGNITDGDGAAGFYAKDINLIVDNGSIGTLGDSIRIGNNTESEDTRLNAYGKQGVYLESSDTDLTVAKVKSPNGNIRLETNRAVDVEKPAYNDSNFEANNITIHSGDRIGGADNRAVFETLQTDGRINLSAQNGISLEQIGSRRFYSDYIINENSGLVSLLLPNNHVFIKNISLNDKNALNIQFTNNIYFNGINIGYNDVRKLVINPASAISPFQQDREKIYEILKLFNENIIVSPDLFNFANMRYLYK
ncbi:MAG: hypothetical protein LBV16_09280 [Elusimicrobiota bacterium]|jgi:hypothetical protein|nr:hypothetical protein [Elusimicrobiota bacterium]